MPKQKPLDPKAPFFKFAERLRTERSKKAWTLNQAAIASKVQSATISQWEQGFTDPARANDEKMRSVALVYGLHVDTLRYGSGAMGAPVSPVFSDSPIEDDEVVVVVYDLRAAAGYGEVAPDFVETLEPHRFKVSWLQAKRLKAENLRVITTSGDSMAPFINPGDKLVVDKSDTVPGNGHVYVVWYGGEIRVKRVYREKDGAIRLESDNPKYAPDVFKGRALKGLKIYGRVRDRSGDHGL